MKFLKKLFKKVDKVSKSCFQEAEEAKKHLKNPKLLTKEGDGFKLEISKLSFWKYTAIVAMLGLILTQIFGISFVPGMAMGKEVKSAQLYLKFKKIKTAFMPLGIPAAYGKELNISFDSVQDAINKVKPYGPDYGNPAKKITLNSTELSRYKKIGESIACEYCCGVTTMTLPDGSAACGCDHSIMMRGLTAYLIKNHPSMSDSEILKELEKWKRTYFPKQTLSAEFKRLKDAGDKDIEEIIKEFPDFLPQMVGGC